MDGVSCGCELKFATRTHNPSPSGGQVFCCWIKSQNPAALDVAQAPGGEENAKGAKHKKIEGKGHGVPGVEGAVEDVGAISKRQNKGEGFDERGQVGNREKKPAKENHGEAEEVGKGLGLKDLAHRDCDEKAHERVGHGDEKDGRSRGAPCSLRKVGQLFQDQPSPCALSNLPLHHGAHPIHFYALGSHHVHTKGHHFSHHFLWVI